MSVLNREMCAFSGKLGSITVFYHCHSFKFWACARAVVTVRLTVSHLCEWLHLHRCTLTLAYVCVNSGHLQKKHRLKFSAKTEDLLKMYLNETFQ